MTEGYSLPRRLDTDPESVQRDLMKLVLTIIELVRQLMERQAIRRVDEGDLADEQVEELGLGLMRPEEVPIYVELLLERVRSENFPSIPMMARIKRLA